VAYVGPYEWIEHFTKYIAIDKEKKLKYMHVAFNYYTLFVGSIALATNNIIYS